MTDPPPGGASILTSYGCLSRGRNPTVLPRCHGKPVKERGRTGITRLHSIDKSSGQQVQGQFDKVETSAAFYNRDTFEFGQFLYLDGEKNIILNSFKLARTVFELFKSNNAAFIYVKELMFVLLGGDCSISAASVHVNCEDHIPCVESAYRRPRSGWFTLK